MSEIDEFRQLQKQGHKLQIELSKFPDIKGSYIDFEINDIIIKLKYLGSSVEIDSWITEAKNILYRGYFIDAFELFDYTYESYINLRDLFNIDLEINDLTKAIHILIKMLYAIESMAEPSAYGLPDNFTYLNEIVDKEVTKKINIIKKLREE